MEKMDVDEDYVDMKTNPITINVRPAPRKQKPLEFEKRLIVVILLFSLILVASSALVTAAYLNNIKTLSKLNALQKEIWRIEGYGDQVISPISGQLNNLEVSLNETRMNCTYLEDAIHRLKNHSSSIEKKIEEIQNQTFKEINELNQIATIYFDNIATNITFQMEYLNNVSEKFTNSSSVTKYNLNALQTELIHDLKFLHVFDSCADIFQLSLPFPSGTYWIKWSENSTIPINCTPSCDGSIGKWRRIALMNTSDGNPFQCPGELEKRNDPPSCRRKIFNAGCSSVYYENSGASYSQICGQIHSRQSGSPDGFQFFGGNRRDATLEENYVDGVSLTYGKNPRKHIWTLAASVNALGDECAVCDRERPNYIEMDYSCEVTRQCPDSIACSADPLWDGDQCVGNSPFYRQLSQYTTDDIELRVCRGQNRNDEDILITFIEIFAL